MPQDAQRPSSTLTTARNSATRVRARTTHAALHAAAAPPTPTASAPPAAPASPAPGGSALQQAWLVILTMRPRQWTKNALLFAGVTFAGRLLDGAALARAALAFVIFCLLAGATYLINDLADLERDRLHPRKRLRPLASGRLTRRAAIFGVEGALALVALCVVALAKLPTIGQAWRLQARLIPLGVSAQTVASVSHSAAYNAFGGATTLFTLTALAYFVSMLAYTFRLKHMVLLDVFTIAIGFVLRAVAGAVVVAVHISPWLYLCTILLALFLALGKRRQELLALDVGASEHRRNLADYTPQLLDQLITITVTATIIAYSLYTFQGETGDRRLMLTIPFVLYGVFRYLYLVYARGEGGSPEEILLRDAHVRWCVVLCALTIAVVLYVLPT